MHDDTTTWEDLTPRLAAIKRDGPRPYYEGPTLNGGHEWTDRPWDCCAVPAEDVMRLIEEHLNREPGVKAIIFPAIRVSVTFYEEPTQVAWVTLRYSGEKAAGIHSGSTKLRSSPKTRPSRK